MQQVQEMSADGIVVGLHLDALAVVGVVMPVEQHRSQRGHQAIGDVARAWQVVVVGFGQDATQRGNA